jgi:hypothetical protein
MCDGMLMIYKICLMEILDCHLVFVSFGLWNAWDIANGVLSCGNGGHGG